MSNMNNQEKNTYVKNQLTQALLRLLEKKHLTEITVSELAEEAGVGRASFYRNYADLTDILRRYDLALMQEWGKSYEADLSSKPENLFGSLFSHYKRHSGFYLMLQREGVLHITLATIMSICGPRADDDNKTAYTKAFFAHGLYGWVEEWLSRGLTETADEMDKLLFQNDIVPQYF